MCEQYERQCVTVEIKDQYFNMREKVEPVKHIVEIAEKAMKEVGIEPIIKAYSRWYRWRTTKFYGTTLPEHFCRRT